MFIRIKGIQEMNLFPQAGKAFHFWLGPKTKQKTQGLFFSSSFIFTKAKTKERFPQFYGTSLSY